MTSLNQAPTISVIIPVFRAETHLKDCLSALLTQEYLPSELILVDDCSPDQSMEVARQTVAACNCPQVRVQYVRLPQNAGVANARNQGLAHASGDYVFFLDSDDIVTPDCLKTLISEAKAHQWPDIVMGAFDIVGGEDRGQSQVVFRDAYTDRHEEMVHRYCSGEIYCMVWNQLVRREVITANKLSFLKGVSSGEDNLWSFYLFNKAQSLLTLSKVTLHYQCWNQNALTSISLRRKMNDRMRVAEDMQSSFNQGRLERSKDNLQYYWAFRWGTLVDLRKYNLVSRPGLLRLLAGELFKEQGLRFVLSFLRMWFFHK